MVFFDTQKYVLFFKYILTYVLIRAIIRSRGEEMNAGELKRKLKKIGCYKHREGKRHEMWYSPITGKQFPVSRHDSQEVAAGTLRSIKEDSGLE